MKPTVTLIYAKGCPACEAALPEFRQLALRLPSWRFNVLDADKPGLNLDFPVNYTPTLHFSIGSRRYVTDPPTLKHAFDEEYMGKWLGAAVQKWTREGRP